MNPDPRSEPVITTASMRRPSSSRAGRARGLSQTELLFFVTVIMLLLAILLPSLARARELSKRLVCAANLKGLGVSMMLYAQSEPGGQFPTPQDLVASGDVTPKQLVCPSSRDRVGDCSYRFVPIDPAKRSDRDPALTVWGYESKDNHKGAGGCVLFLDGSVRFVKSEEYDRLLGPLGVNP